MSVAFSLSEIENLTLDLQSVTKSSVCISTISWAFKDSFRSLEIDLWFSRTKNRITFKTFKELRSYTAKKLLLFRKFQ